MIFKFFVVLLLCLPIFAKSISYGEFMDKQIELTFKLDNEKIIDEEVEQIIEEKEKLFNKKLEEILANKDAYINLQNPYPSKIYRLKKIISINKRRGNEYAVIRDEVLVKSYKILQSQNNMVVKILQALDMEEFDEFSNYINNIFVKNQEEILKINNVDYKPYLQVTKDSSIVRNMKKRIKEYYAILEINAELLKMIVDAQRKMYRLNKYYKYGLIKPVLYINHTSLSHSLEPLLARFNLSTVKIILILLILFFLIILRKIIIKIFTKVFENLKFKHYTTKKILKGLTKPITIITILMGMNLIVYVYNDFSRMHFVSSFFDMAYVIITMWSIYKVINIIATVKINRLAEKSTNLKSELVNISIKIVNFTILLVTVLLLLHLAGVNLTAILSGLGIGGFAIALAAKDSLANFFGTLSILISDTFSQGDWIVIDDIEGVVVEIGLRVTTIRTFDNALISVPNSKLANEAIKNWSKRKVGRRIKFKVSLKYNSPREKIIKAVEDIREYLAKNEKIAKESSSKVLKNNFDTAKIVEKNDALGIKNMQLVVVDELADTSIDIMVNCFSVETTWSEWAMAKEEVILEVMKIVEKNKLEFALPSLSIRHQDSLHVKLEKENNN